MRGRAAAWQGGGPPFAIGSKPLGMWLFVVSDALTFLALLIAYGWLRMSNPGWPTPFDLNNILGAVAMTIALVCSSVSMAAAVRAIKCGDRNTAVTMLAGTIALGLGFLILHALEWRRLTLIKKVTLTSNPWDQPLFGATFFGLTGLHMAHVLAGVVYLSIVAIAVRREKLHAEDVVTCGIYWQFVDVVWLFLFPLVYLTQTQW
jgi:cytochrome c oxidase subunit 3